MTLSVTLRTKRTLSRLNCPERNRPLLVGREELLPYGFQVVLYKIPFRQLFLVRIVTKKELGGRGELL